MKTLWLLSLILFFTGPVNAQSAPAAAPQDELFRTIASLDGQVFDAFNRCDLEKLGSFFTEELEFYHDNGGLTNQTRRSARRSSCTSGRRRTARGRSRG
jgi:hypothetical protein